MQFKVDQEDMDKSDDYVWKVTLQEILISSKGLFLGLSKSRWRKGCLILHWRRTLAHMKT